MNNSFDDIHEEISHEDYYEGNKPNKKNLNNAQKVKNLLKDKIIRKAILIFVCALIAVIVFIFGDNLVNWFKTEMIGIEPYSTYPTDIIGSEVRESNVVSENGNIALLSDTAFTILDENAMQLFSYKHSYLNPSLSQSGGNYIFFSIGGQDYTTVSSDLIVKNHDTDDKVIATTISSNGTYAVATQPVDYTSKFEVYSKSGKIKFRYDFAQGYICSICLNDNGTGGVVALADSNDGILYSKIYFFDFSQEHAIATYESSNNLMLDISYNGNNSYYLIGDTSLLEVNHAGMNEFSYEDKTVTAVSTYDNKAIISLTNYSGDGPCTVYLFDGGIVPKTIDTDVRVEDIGLVGNRFALLCDANMSVYDLNMNLISNKNVGFDVGTIAMKDKNNAYIIALKEIRLSSIYE